MQKTCKMILKNATLTLKTASLIPFLASFFLFSVTANAQSVLKQHDTKQPLDISAERLEMQQKQGRAIFSGAVQVTQGNLTLRSDNMTVFYALEDDKRDPAISRLDAEGAFRLTSATETLTGDWGIYDVDRQLVTVGGNVSFTQGSTELKGSRLEFDLVSGTAKLDGEATDQTDGRVRGSFTVPSKPDDPQNNN